MGIEHGYDVDRILWLGRQMERTVATGCAEAAINGRTFEQDTGSRPGLAAKKS
jgi:hydroxymethylglutaryl-CoA lyase